MKQPILVLFYSVHGSTEKLAGQIARGINSVGGVEARVRTVPKVSTVCEKIADEIPDLGVPYVTKQDLAECIGLAMGSPVRFGNMAASMKYFWDSTVEEWLNGDLIGKPACAFSSSSSLHGGQEACILSMMLPLMHHGMILLSLPYSNMELNTTKSGGTPYGVTHVDWMQKEVELTKEEKQLAFAQGKLLAETALKLKRTV
jgi:NAD(P)H dehydrogenase (quinone)